MAKCGLCHSGTGAEGSTCGHGLVQFALKPVERETLRIAACNVCVAGGWVIDKHLAYHHSSNAQQDERDCCENSHNDCLPSNHSFVLIFALWVAINVGTLTLWPTSRTLRTFVFGNNWILWGVLLWICMIVVCFEGAYVIT